MKKFLLLALMLLGFLGVKAEKLNLTFGVDWYCTASWDGSTNTFKWGSGGVGNPDWTFINITNVNGDVSKYTKLYFKLADFNNSVENKLTLYFKENRGNTQTMDYVAKIDITPNANGEFEFDLKNFDWKNNKTPSETIDKTNIYDVTLYGGARTDGSQDGSVKIVEAYLEKPDPTTREVYSLGTPITFEQALASSDPFVLVQNGKVFCGPTSPSDGALTFKDVSEINDYSWTIKFEEDASNAGSYFMELYNTKGSSKGYVNGSIWCHTFLSGVDKNGTKGERQDGALWTVTALGNGKYSIRNLGVAEGNYGDDHTSQGYLAINNNPYDYWVNHVTIYNTSGEWEFYTLSTALLPAEDPKIFAWEDLSFDGAVTVNNDKRVVSDSRDWAFYWAPSAHWDLPENARDISDYRYLVVYSTQNASDHNGAIYITDGDGTTMRGDEYKKYNDTNYPTPVGSMVLDVWSNQHIAVIDLDFLANTDKFGDASPCKYINTKNVTSIGVSASAEGACLNFAYLTNTLPNTNGDYTRNIDTFEKFGTICLPYSAVCSGAEIYEIAGKSSNGISLNRYYGVMEAGKPYFYKTVEAKIGYWNGNGVSFKDEDKLYFFKAGYEQVQTPVENNGLIGSFTKGTVPQGENYYVVGRLADDTEDKIFQVDSEVTLPANRAYIDKSKIADIAVSSRSILLGFDGAENEATAIKSTEAAEVVTDAVFYDMSGREVKNPTAGIYIVRYGNKTKKVMIK